MDKNQEKKPSEMKQPQNTYPGTGQGQKVGPQQSFGNPNSASKPGSSPDQKAKEKQSVNEAPSKEDWEGGGSRPQPEEETTVPGKAEKEEYPYPRPVEMGQKPQKKDFKPKNQDSQRRKAG